MEDEIQSVQQTQDCPEHAERQNQNVEKTIARLAKKDRLLATSIFISAVTLAGAWIYTARLKLTATISKEPVSTESQNESLKTASVIAAQQASPLSLGEKVLPSKGIMLPIQWGGLGVKMVSVGVVDKEKFDSLYAARGGLAETERKLLEDSNVGTIKMTKNNSGFLLNLFWALGLSTKNEILERGEIANPQFGGPGNFASTGGWTLAAGDAMDHYSRHPFIVLTPEQQKLVEGVSKNIYRPCCDNSTHFPDCNHGMAMLGLLELLASQGVSEREMYNIALQANAYWFPDAYMTIAQYSTSRGLDWGTVNPKDIVGMNYSSASGFRQIQSLIPPPAQKSSGGCGA